MEQHPQQHQHHDRQQTNGSSPSPAMTAMMVTTSSSISPSEAFSECMSHLLMNTEELRRSCIQATTQTTTVATRTSPTRTLASSSSSVSAAAAAAAAVIHHIQPDQVFSWQDSLEHSILPLLDQLARWTADVANPTSIEADLLEHCQNKAIAVVAQQQTGLLETVMKHYSEAALVDQAEAGGGAAMNAAADGGCVDGTTPLLWLDGEPLDIVLRNVQGSIARITELCLVLIAGNENLPSGGGGGGGGSADADAAKQQQQKLESIKTIVQSYVSYQRQVLRQRCRPAIAKLVQIRKQQQQQQQQQQQTVTALQHPHRHHLHHHGTDDDDDHDDDDQPSRVVVEQHHAAALTVILGQAAALIHPLIVWKMTLQQQIQHHQQMHQHDGGIDATVNPAMATTAALYRLCTNAISTLDEQTCTLTRTVSDWFYQDRPVDDYMQKCAAEVSIPQGELVILDGLVEEMAYTSQVLARYHALLLAAASSTSGTENPNHTDKKTDNASSSASVSFHAWIHESLHLPQTLDAVIERELIPEWTWKYAALERFLAVQQWQSAAGINTIVAQPVQIVMGTRIFVPSIVEDAQYLSTRALERAASTRSTLAIGTVAHAVAHDVWSTEEQQHVEHGGGGGVHQALLQERGCFAAPPEQEESEGNKKKNPLGGDSDFAAALLDALDEDLGSKQHSSSTSPPHSSKTTALPRHPSAPSSGGFLTSTLLAVGGGGMSSTPTDQVLLETRCCVLNGIHAAAGACRSLVEFLDTLLLDPDDPDDDSPASALQQPNTGSSNGSVNSNDQATAMIHLAREDLFRYAKDYDKLLSDRFRDTLTMWCGGGGGSTSRRKLCFDELRAFFEGEDYNIDAAAMKKAEADERLEHDIVAPLKESLLLQQLSDRCESDVLRQLGQVMVTTVVDIVLDSLWSSTENKNKKMTDWGSLLLSKQVRLLQSTFSKILAQDSADAGGVLLSSSGAAGPNLIQQWERLYQVCNVLQLEQPAEWLMYLDSSVLSAEELKKTMSLRVDFSRDAIQKVVSTAKQRMEVLVVQQGS